MYHEDENWGSLVNESTGLWNGLIGDVHQNVIVLLKFSEHMINLSILFHSLHFAEARTFIFVYMFSGNRIANHKILTTWCNWFLGCLSVS